MIARFLILPFGSIWNLKNKCQSSTGLISKLLKGVYELYQYENSSSIAWNSNFISEPCFPHGMKSIFISGDAVIGKNCTIYQQVTIGSVTLSDAKKIGAPTLGNNVYIGSGAKIVGKVIIGDNVRIGANAVVYKDVPSNSIVVLGEQKNIRREMLLDNKTYTFHGRWVYFEDGSYVDVLNQEIIKKLNEGFNKL